MKIIKPDNLSLLFTTFMLEERLVFAVAAMGFFTLDTTSEDRLLPEPEMWKVAAEALEKDEALDLGLPKHRAEYLVYGSCFSKHPVPSMLVKVEVGKLSKTLQVSGDRKVIAGIPGKPSLFTSIRIDYGNAYGGPGYELNPLGKGYAQDECRTRHMPNIQDPKRAVVDLGSRGHVPAGLTAYPLMWPERAKHLGKFDSEWLQKRWPYYPLDTDPEYFNASPEDQRFQGFLLGDELIRILNMHPEKPDIVSSLPGVRARIFANKMVEGKESFVEAKAHAETVWLFPDRERGIVLFRGVTPVENEEMDDVLHLMAEWEPLDQEPNSLEHYHETFLKTIHPAEAEAVAAEPVEEEVEQAPVAEIPAGEEAPPKAPELPPELAVLEKDIAALEKETDARLEQLGMTRDKLTKKYFPERKHPAPLSPEELEKAISDLEKETDARIKQLGMTREELSIKFLPQEKPAPPATPRDLLKQISDLENQTGARLKELGMTREGVMKKFIPDAAAAVSPLSLKEIETLVEQHEAEMVAAAATPVLPEIPAPVMPSPGDVSPLTVETVMERYRNGESLSGLDAGGLDFTGQDLSKADFRNAALQGAVFANASLDGADFSGAILSDARFPGARLEGARFLGSTGTDSRFEDAKLGHSDFSEADFSGASFMGADLSGAVFEKGVFEKAQFQKAKATGARASKADFLYADFTEGDLSGADLSEADFSYTVLTRARFSEANAEKIRLHGATGVDPDFRKAKMVQSRGDRDTSFKGGNFHSADLTRSCWDGARLEGVQLEEAVLDDADFSRVTFQDGCMLNSVARGANFMKAEFVKTDMRGINLFKASLRKAKVTESDLKSSNLYGVDLYGAKIKGSDTKDANLNGTLLKVKL